MLPFKSATLQKEALPMTRFAINRPAMDTSLPSKSSKCSLISCVWFVTSYFVISNGSLPSSCKVFNLSIRFLICSLTSGICVLFFSATVLSPYRLFIYNFYNLILDFACRCFYLYDFSNLLADESGTER